MKNEEINKMPDIKVQGWKIKDLAEQSSNKGADEILKEVLAGSKAEPSSQIPNIEAFKVKQSEKDGKQND